MFAQLLDELRIVVSRTFVNGIFGVFRTFFVNLSGDADMTVVERIKESAKKRGYNLKTTAIKAGLGENVIYGWQKYTPSSDKLKAVAGEVNITPTS